MKFQQTGSSLWLQRRRDALRKWHQPISLPIRNLNQVGTAPLNVGWCHQALTFSNIKSSRSLHLFCCSLGDSDFEKQPTSNINQLVNGIASSCEAQLEICLGIRRLLAVFGGVGRHTSRSWKKRGLGVTQFMWFMLGKTKELPGNGCMLWTLRSQLQGPGHSQDTLEAPGPYQSFWISCDDCDWHRCSPRLYISSI